MKRFLTLWLVLVCTAKMALATNYAHVFGADWNEAMKYVQANRCQWKPTFDTFDIDCHLAEAIVFPELIRYSRWKDQIEQAAVTGLYVHGGKEKADFSIGRFQMKPSFAEQVESDWNASDFATEYGFSFDTRKNSDARRQRVKRLTDETWQYRYLALFVCLQIKRHPELKSASKEKQVKLLSTAYNRSYTATTAQLQRMAQQRHFHTDIIATRNTQRYRYADIAWQYYRQP